MIIDFHVHAFPDNVAPKAMEALFSTYNKKPATDGTISSLTSELSDAGVDLAVIQPVATNPRQVKSINNWASSHEEPNIISFAGMHPEYDDIQGEIDRIISLGLKGIKIQGNFQNIYVDAPYMYPIYEAAQGKLMMLFHAGAEIAPLTEDKATPKRLAKVHNDFPNLTIIAAHMGGYMMWDESEEYLIGKDIYIDTSACFENMISDERLLNMIRKHGADKVLYATDMPLGVPKKELARLQRIGLTDNELEQILGTNAMRLLNMS